MIVRSGSPSQLFCALLAFILLAPVAALTNDDIFSSSFEQPKVPGATDPLNDTGITTSMADESCIDVAQDCSYGRDSTHNDDADGHAGFSFAKLDMSGNTLSASATNWACVKDNVTGLIWEVKTDDGDLRDTDNTYTWYNPDSSISGGDSGTANGGSCTGSDCDTSSYVDAVNTLPVALCGHRDWRMPWAEDLLSIIDYGLTQPAIDADYFPRGFGPGYAYRTDSIVAYYGRGFDWIVRFYDAHISAKVDDIPQHVMLVRDGDDFSFLAQGELP